jgi:hypothetical protein
MDDIVRSPIESSCLWLVNSEIAQLIKRGKEHKPHKSLHLWWWL